MAEPIIVEPAEMKNYIGKELGVSDWVEVTQEKINMFADATGDHQWIHTDPEKAKQLYEHFADLVSKKGLWVESGQFQETMAVSLVNDGPVTLIIESK